MIVEYAAGVLQVSLTLELEEIVLEEIVLDLQRLQKTVISTPSEHCPYRWHPPCS